MIQTYNIELIFENKTEEEHWKNVLETSRSIYNEVSDIIWEHRKEAFSLTNIHSLVYDKMREKYPDFPSQGVIKTYKNLISNYRANKKKFKCKKQNLSINLDKNLYSRYTITSIDIPSSKPYKRTKVKFKLYKRFVEISSLYKMMAPTIFYRNNKFYLGVPFEVPEKPVIEETYLGVDLGIKRFFTTSDGYALKTSNLNKIKRKLRHNKRKFQSKKKNSHSARKKLRKLSHKERNINKEFVHQAVNELLKTDKTIIVLEDLTGIKQKTSRTKEGFKKKKHNNMFS